MRQKTDHSSENVLQGFRLGREAAFDTIFKEFYPVLYYYCVQITGDMPAAQDIVEETFIRTWEKRATIQDIKSYLYRVVKNASLDWIEKENRRRTAEELASRSIPVSENGAWEALVKAELIRELQAAINQLSPQRQRVIKMLYNEGMSVKQVAAALQVGLSTVKEHKKEGILFLRKILPRLVIIGWWLYR